jgi:hypothetical protein
MGLLDDAIREHLELKRLRGADPSEVILEEREALDPVLREAEAAPSTGGVVPAERAASANEAPVGLGRAADPATAPIHGEPRHLGQETVELDMRSVLGEEPLESVALRAEVDAAPPLARAAPARAGVGPSSPETSPTGDCLEWEVPGERRRSVSERLREEGFASARGVLDESGVPAGDAREVASDADSSQEHLWFGRQSARDLSLGR